MKDQQTKYNNVYVSIIDGVNGDYIKSKSIGKKLDFGIHYMDIDFSGVFCCATMIFVNFD